MPISHVLILGAGPAGLAAAIALSQLSTASNDVSLRITVLELRSELTTLGGSINLTPLAMRYLDRLGAGVRLRPKGIPVRAIEMLSLRTGRSLGNVWANIDALRVMRHDLVTAMLETAKAPEHSERITVQYGARVVAIREDGSLDSEDGKVVLTLESGEEVQGDVLLGCDGLHSVARAKYVEPERQATYSGKGAAYGFIEVKQPGKVDVMQSGGKPALVDSSMITGRYGSLLLSFFEESRCQVYLAAVMSVKQEHEGSKEGWRAMGEDKARIKKDILTKFDGGKVAGLTDFLGKVDDWTFYPVYLLPPNGRWTRGRVILLGDAAHAMPPQGESTGVAIEDGMLIAHVFQRHKSRSVAQLLRDYESLRRSTIDRLYKQTVWRWENAAGGKSSWIWAILMEWITVWILMIMNLKKEDYFASDVSRLELPS